MTANPVTALRSPDRLRWSNIGWATAASAFVTFAIVALVTMQFFWLKVGLFVYTEAAGPVLHIAERQLPLLMVIYDSVLFAVVAVLCVPEADGRPAVVVNLMPQPAAHQRPHRSRLRPVPLPRRQGVRPIRPSAAGGQTGTVLSVTSSQTN